MTAADHIQQILILSQQLIDLAVAGSEAADDDGCLLLFGIVQDCAYKMRRAAEKERQLHDRTAQNTSQAVPADRLQTCQHAETCAQRRSDQAPGNKRRWTSGALVL